MFIEMKTECDEGFSDLCDRLEAEGFENTPVGFVKQGADPADRTTVHVLGPQRAVEIYFGQMGTPKRVSRDNVTPEAKYALGIALDYVRPARIRDHTSYEVDPNDILGSEDA